LSRVFQFFKPKNLGF